MSEAPGVRDPTHPRAAEGGDPGEPEPALSTALDRLRDLASWSYGPDDALELGPGVRKVLDDPAGSARGRPTRFRHHAPRAAGGDGRRRRPPARRGLRQGAPGGGAGRARGAGRGRPRPRRGRALDQLVWGPPTGRVPNARREVRIESGPLPHRGAARPRACCPPRARRA
ncbi:hypothetical protein [Nonomuraea rubra]|uniref:hypothetical protein n=1 Tax=Nonomuraea rubra TaxID=46180 RepID=UPI0031E60A6E